MDPFLKRTWAEIDLDAIEHNYKTIRDNVDKHAKIMCVIKADAYGHGAVRLAHEYERLGADFLGVSNIEEAIQLRNAEVNLPILILGFTPPSLAPVLANKKITQAVVSLDHAKRLSYYASLEGKKVDVHVKVDTGMSRVGLLAQTHSQADNTVNAIKEMLELKGIGVEGLFTHFVVSDEGEASRDFTNLQFERFSYLKYRLGQKGIKALICHCANSGATIDYPEMALDMVRLGIILYGLMPSDKLARKLYLRQAMDLKSTISLIKEVDKDTPVSYGKTYMTQGKTRIATVPIGYADGYKRSLSNKASMIVRGQRVKVIGRICMDQTMLDVTSVADVDEGDIVTVFGSDEHEKISIDEVSRLCNTINYEIVCLIGKRVPRIYYKNGEIVGRLNYICP